MHLPYRWIVLCLLLMPLPCHALTPNWAYCLEVSPDGKTVAANFGGEEDISLFNLDKGKEIAHFGTVSPADRKSKDKQAPMISCFGWVRQITFSPDNRFLACAVISLDADVILWDLHQKDPKPLRIQAPQPYVNHRAVAFSPDSLALVTYMQASPNGSDFLIAWNPSTGKEIWRQNLGKDKVQDVTFSPDRAAVAVTDPDNIRWYDTSTGRTIASPEGLPPTSQAALPVITLLDDAKRIVVKTADGASQHELHPLDKVMAILATPQKLVIAEVNLGLQVWNATDGKLLFKLGHAEPVPSTSHASLFESTPSPPPATTPAADHHPPTNH